MTASRATLRHFRPALPLLALLAGAACQRDLSLPKPAVLAIGLSCTADAQCDGSRCRDGVCCLADCAASQTCAGAGHIGTCTARGLGDTCTADAQCGAAGLCVDGVCCESPCSGDCRTCAAAGTKGKCVTQADNHDDRAKCASCFACFGGTCAPALPGTDPAGRCGAGLVCSARLTCGVPQGGACAKATDCAVGDCLASACSVLAREPVSSSEMVPQPTGRTLRGFAATPSGAAAVLYGEFSNQGGDPLNGELLENDLWLALRSPPSGGAGGAWRASPLFRDLGANPGALHAALVSVGEYYYLAAASDAAEARSCPADTCGVRGLLLAPSGQPSRAEAIDADARRAYAVTLLREGGQLFTFYEAQRAGGNNRVHARSGTLGAGPTTWADVPGFPVFEIADAGFAWAVALSGTTPVLLHNDQAYGSKLIASSAGQADEQVDLTDACGAIDFMRAGSVPLGNGQSSLLVGVFCPNNHSAFVLHDPRRPAGQRLKLVPLPAFTFAVVPAGLFGGGVGLLVAGQFDPEVSTARIQLGLIAADGTSTWRTVWEPRGLDDLRDFLTTPVGALPGLVVLSGPVQPKGQDTLTPPITLELVQYQR